MSDNVKIKLCPWCGGEAEKPYVSDTRCKDPECPAHYFVTWMPYKVWQQRPLEDALRLARDQAEGELAVLRKMHNITKTHSELLHENSWLWEKMKLAEECIDKGSAQVKQLQSERDRAREMIARLIEAGEILHATIADIDYERHAYPCLAWHALVAEWQANQKGDSNV